MKLYLFDWGMYPRRVLVYLAEKGITDIEQVLLDPMLGETREAAHLARNPSGTVPVLETDDGAFIRQSVAILEYLEETVPGPDMIGGTPTERARTRDMLSMSSELYTYLTRYWAHASPAMAQRFDQKADAAAAAYADYEEALRGIERVVADGEFLCGDRVTIADCAMFGTAQFADRLYREPITDATPRLKAWYDRFALRPSAAVPAYPAMLVEHAPPRR